MPPPSQSENQKTLRENLQGYFRTFFSEHLPFLLSSAILFYLTWHFVEFPQDRLQVLDISIQSVLTFFLLAFTLAIARQQNNLQKQMLTLEQRRAHLETVSAIEPLYAAYRVFIAEVLTRDPLPKSIISKFVESTVLTQPLLGNGMAELRTEIIERANEIANEDLLACQRVGFFDDCSQFKRIGKNKEAQEKRLDWFMSLFSRIDHNFAPYLHRTE